MTTYKLSFFILLLSITIKLIGIHYTNFDLFGDEAQYWLWSQTPELGYYSKPPLLAWLLKLHTLLFGNSFEALKYFPFIFYFFISYAVYLLSYELYQNKKLAIITALSFYLLPSVSVSSFLISTDVILIFFCSLSLLTLLRIRKKPSIDNFILLGIFFGLSFLAKYAALYYLFSLILMIVLDRKLRKAFALNYINILVFLVCLFIVLLPNILWNIQNGWITLFHTADNVGLERVNLNVIRGIEFLLLQSVMLGPVLFFSFIFYLKKIKFSFQTKFLLIFSLPVFCIIFIESILVRANANWAAVGLIPIFILITNHAYNYSKKIIQYNNIVNFLFCFVLFCLIATSSNLKIFDRINGISDFANTLKANYLEKTNYLIIENRLLYSSLSYYLKNSNKILLTPHNPKNKITSHFHLSGPLKPYHNKNFIFIGNPDSLNYLEKNPRAIKQEEVNVKFFNNSIKIYEVVF